MLKLIVFDCDGVMFDSKMANSAYYNHLLERFGHPPMSEDELEFVHMNSVTSSVQHIFRHYATPSIDVIHAYREECGYGPFLQYMSIEPDLVDFLDKTYGKYHLAISTNRTNTMVPLLESHNLRHYFEKVVTAATAARPKPAPDGLLEILDFFSCSPEEAIFIGDSIIDEEHARSCDVPLIAFKSKLLTAAFHVQSFTEILSLPPFLEATAA
jgi:phosphoglycolate phosphatase